MMTVWRLQLIILVGAVRDAAEGFSVFLSSMGFGPLIIAITPIQV